MKRFQEHQEPFNEADVSLEDPFSGDVCRAKRPSRRTSGIKTQQPQGQTVKVVNPFEHLSPPFQEHDMPGISDPFLTMNASMSSPSDLDSDFDQEESDSTSTTSGSGYPEDDDPMSDPFATFEFDTLPSTFEGSDEKIYPSSPMSILQVLALLFSWFTSCPGISKEAFGHLLNLLHMHVLPAGNRLPNSYRQALGMVKSYLVPVNEYDCCVNDCILFRNSAHNCFKDLAECPVCGESRYHPGTQTARKKFKYIPLRHRIQRMFKSKHVSELLQQHSKVVQGKETIHSLHETSTWKQWYSPEGVFKGDPRGLSFGLCTDGVNPYAKEKVSYSMWPIMLSILNLPHQLRMLAGSMLLVGIIPGKSEPQNTDPYLGPLVDELHELCQTEMYDGFRDERFTVKATINLHTLDYPGQCKVFHSHGANAYAGCCYCCIKGEYSHQLTKMVYLGSRSFLPPPHHLHDDKRNFPKKTDERKRPQDKDMSFLDNENGKYAAAISMAEKKRIAQEGGCKGPYALRRLPGHERVLNTPVDPMHLVKNIAEHIVHLVVGKEDSVKVRRDEKHRNRFRSTWVSERTVPHQLPHAPFRLTKEETAKANE